MKTENNLNVLGALDFALQQSNGMDGPLQMPADSVLQEFNELMHCFLNRNCLLNNREPFDKKARAMKQTEYRPVLNAPHRSFFNHKRKNAASPHFCRYLSLSSSFPRCPTTPDCLPVTSLWEQLTERNKNKVTHLVWLPQLDSQNGTVILSLKCFLQTPYFDTLPIPSSWKHSLPRKYVSLWTRLRRHSDSNPGCDLSCSPRACVGGLQALRLPPTVQRQASSVDWNL